MQSEYDAIVDRLDSINAPGCGIIMHDMVYPTGDPYQMVEFRKEVSGAHHSLTALYGSHGDELAYHAAVTSAMMAARSSQPVRYSMFLINRWGIDHGERSYAGFFKEEPSNLVYLDLNRFWTDPLSRFQSGLYNLVTESMLDVGVIADHHSDAFRGFMQLVGVQGYISTLETELLHVMTEKIIGPLKSRTLSMVKESLRFNMPGNLFPQENTFTRYLNIHNKLAIAVEDNLGDLERKKTFHSWIDAQLMEALIPCC